MVVFVYQVVKSTLTNLALILHNVIQLMRHVDERVELVHGLIQVYEEAALKKKLSGFVVALPGRQDTQPHPEHTPKVRAAFLHSMQPFFVKFAKHVLDATVKQFTV